jgi:hypothetical protein
MVLFIALCFRLYDISRSPWIDEILTRDGSLDSVKSALSQKFYPLTYLLVHFALRIEDTPFMLRLPSLLAGLAGIWMTYQAGRTAHSRGAGLLAAGLLAINSSHIVYSQEARFYSFLAAATPFAGWMLWRALERGGRKYWLGFAAAVSFGALSQGLFYLYLDAITLPAIAWLLVRRRRAEPGSFGKIRSLVVSLVLGLVPAVVAFLVHRSLALGTQTIISGDNNDAEMATFRLTFSEYCYDLYEMVNCYPVRIVNLLVWAAGLGIVVLWKRNRAACIVCLGGLFLTPFPLFFITVHHWYNTKYFIGQLPLFLLLSSVGMAAAGQFLTARISPILAPMLLLVLAGKIAFSHELYDYRTYAGRMRFKIREWQDVVPPIIERMTPDDLVVHMSRFRRTVGFGKKGTPIEWYEMHRYLERTSPPGHLPIYPQEYTGTSSTLELRDILEANSTRTVWLVVDRFAKYEFEPPINTVLKTETETFRHLVYSVGEPTINLVKQPVSKPGEEKQHPFRMTCPGGTTVSMEVRRMPVFGEHSATTAAVPLLEPGRNYTLSAYISYKGIRPDPDKNAAGEPIMNEKTAGFIGLSGVLLDGRGFERKLTLYDGNSDWKQAAFRLTPEQCPELSRARSINVNFGVGDKKGSMRVDKVQLEPKDHATPFIPGERLPHTDELANAEQAHYSIR